MSSSAFPSHHMTPDDFRRHGRAVIDWIADYMERVEAYPVLSQARPGEIRANLPAEPPLHTWKTIPLERWIFLPTVQHH